MTTLVTRARGNADNMTTPELKSFLSEHLLLGQLDARELDSLMPFVIVERFRANEVVFRKGDPGQSLRIIMSGRVKVSSSLPDGREVVLAVLERGEIIGEMAIIEDKARSADVSALEPTELLALHKRDFIPFLERNPKLCIRLLGILSERLRHTSEIVRDRTLLGLPSRLAKSLLDLARTHGRDTDEGIRIDMRLSQKMLGGLLGVSRESVNKQLRTWQSEGLIKLGRGYIILREPLHLTRIVEM